VAHVIEALKAKGYGVTIELVEGCEHKVSLLLLSSGSSSSPGEELCFDSDLQHNRNYYSNEERSKTLVDKLEQALASKKV